MQLLHKICFTLKCKHNWPHLNMALHNCNDVVTNNTGQTQPSCYCWPLLLLTTHYLADLQLYTAGHVTVSLPSYDRNRPTHLEQYLPSRLKIDSEMDTGIYTWTTCLPHRLMHILQVDVSRWQRLYQGKLPSILPLITNNKRAWQRLNVGSHK